MSSRSVILLGGPDSGKTNYVGRLWPALDARKGALVAVTQPDDIGFVLDTAEHLFGGNFAPRSEHTDARRNFEIVVADAENRNQSKIVIPDISGELWKNAVDDSEIDADWMAELKRADGALLFVRVNSDQNVGPLDWVTSRRLLAKVGQDEKNDTPTQVMLCELIRYLELTLADQPDGGRPRLSMIVSAWDLVDSGTFEGGPEAYITREYPLLAGRLRDSTLDIRIFGLSVVGGDLTDDEAYRDAYLEQGFDGHGWVTIQDAETYAWRKVPDVTLPVAWVVGI